MSLAPATARKTEWLSASRLPTFVKQRGRGYGVEFCSCRVSLLRIAAGDGSQRRRRWQSWLTPTTNLTAFPQRSAASCTFRHVAYSLSLCLCLSLYLAFSPSPSPFPSLHRVPPRLPRRFRLCRAFPGATFAQGRQTSSARITTLSCVPLSVGCNWQEVAFRQAIPFFVDAVGLYESNVAIFGDTARAVSPATHPPIQAWGVLRFLDPWQTSAIPEW